MLSFINVFWIFIIGSVFGWMFEVAFAFIKTHSFQNRSSLIYGPFGMAYGIGAVFLTTALINFQECNVIEIFIISFLMGTIAEYIMSWGMELVFGFVVWDYSKMPLNINGRVCFLYSLFWGFLGIFWVEFIMDILVELTEVFNTNNGKIFTNIFIIFLLIDIFISFMAVKRRNEREKNIMPRNRIEEFFDKKYNDKFLRKVYPQMYEYTEKR